MYSTDELAVMAIQAGNDILLMSSDLELHLIQQLHSLILINHKL